MNCTITVVIEYTGDMAGCCENIQQDYIYNFTIYRMETTKQGQTSFETHVACLVAVTRQVCVYQFLNVSDKQLLYLTMLVS